MNPKRVLFVDDEPYVLQGLENLLRKHRQRWEMVFALGSDTALAALERASFDVIVSDMRMPGMDGAALLQIVQRQSPATIRIVLSGHADRDGVMRSLPVAHQFLSKPCEAADLYAVIERAGALHTLLDSERLRRAVGRIDALPSAPDAYWALTRAMLQANVSAQDIAGIVEQDPAMSAKVLQLINSAYFSLAHETTSIHSAVTYLGLDLLKGLALTSQVFALAERQPAGLSLEAVQRRSLISARIAKRCVVDPALAEEAFTIGIVHDIGHIILALAFPREYATVTAAAHHSGVPSHHTEKAVFGVSHTEAGAYLLGIWGLPFRIVETVAYHHAPSLMSEGSVEMLAAVHVAGAFVDGETSDAPAALDLPFLRSAGLVDELPKWRDIANEELAKPQEWSHG